MNDEIWLPIKGYEDTHMVSNHGRVKCVDRFLVYRNGYKRLQPGKMLTISIRNNYCSAGLSIGHYKQMMSVHRLVAIAFIPNPENKPVVNHKDCNPLNNHVDNLEWATHRENSQHAVNKGRMNGHNPKIRKKLTPECINEIRILKSGGITHFRISQIYGVSVTLITSILNGKVWFITSSNSRPN